jgi:hypothetical protein
MPTIPGDHLPEFHALADRFEIRSQAKLLSPLRPLILCISLLLAITGLLALSDPTLIDFSTLHYLHFLCARGLAGVYLTVGTLALIGALDDRYELVIPQQLVLVALTAGIFRLAIDEHLSINGVVVPVDWQRALAGGLAIVLLTGFHLAALATMVTSRQEAYVIARDQVHALAHALSSAETSKLTLRSAREINDSICQDLVAARDLYQLGYLEDANDRYEQALAHAQELVTSLIRTTGTTVLAPGEARLDQQAAACER